MPSWTFKAFRLRLYLADLALLLQSNHEVLSLPLCMGPNPSPSPSLKDPSDLIPQCQLPRLLRLSKTK